MVDERAEGRTKTVITGRIIAADGLSAVACSVKDLSEGGAKIEVAAGSDIPDCFALDIPHLATAFDAETRWRYGHLIGVTFIAPAQATRAGQQAKRDELRAGNAELLDTVQKLAGRLMQRGEPLMIALKRRKLG